jgi:hypothetical protein
MALSSLADASLALEVVTQFSGGAHELARHVYDLADALQLAAAPPLIAIADSLLELSYMGFEKEIRECAAAIALVPTTEAAAWLAAHLDQKNVRASASAFFRRVPRLATLMLAPLVASASPSTKKKGGEYAAALLAGIVRAAPDVARSAAAELPGSAARLVETVLDRATAHDEAEAAELPPVLASPPWAAGVKRPKKKKAPVLALEPLPFEEQVITDDHDKPATEALDATATASVAAFEKDVAAGRTLDLWRLDQMPRAAAQALFVRLPASAWDDRWWLDRNLARQLERFGVVAIEPILRFAKAKPGDVATALENAISPRMAPVMAHVLANVKKIRRTAEKWLVANPRAAAIGLLPELFGEGVESRARASAGRALRFLASRGKKSVLAEVAAEYGAACAAAFEESLAADSLGDVPAKPPRLPEWFVPESLPRPRLRASSGKSLPTLAVRALGEMLAFTDPEEPYQGIELVREACDPVSLGDFAWGIFEAWSLAGHPMDQKWAFYAIGHFGRDEHAHRIAALVRRWPSDSAFPRAVLGLDVLATMKSDAAFSLLHGIAEKVKSRPLQNSARQKMESVAESLGLGAEELADRVVPTLGLDDDGSRILDFGARTFRVGFDQHLRPFVRDASGALLTDLPKPGKSDDPARAEAATTEWRTLKKAAKGAGAAQIARLESAMIARRRWEPDAFAMYLVRHPLVTHLVRRLALGVYDTAGSLSGIFRVAEDGTYADGAADTTFVIPEGARVGVLHPLETTPAVLAVVGERFTEYEILQPFPQLGREVPRDATLADAQRFATVDTLKLLGLERRGWRRGPVGDGGVIGTFEREVGPLQASLALETGIYAGDPKMNPTQVPNSLSFTKPDPIFLAEVVADLRAVGAVV